MGVGASIAIETFNKRGGVHVVLLLLILFSGCRRDPPVDEVRVLSPPIPNDLVTDAPTGAESWPSGNVAGPLGFSELGVYFTPSAQVSPIDTFREQFGATLPRFTLLQEIDPGAVLPDASALLQQLDTSEYVPPGPEVPREWLVGIDAAGADQLRNATQVLIGSVRTDQPGNREEHAKLCVLIGSLAEEVNGFVWDEYTREAFAPDTYIQMRCPEGVLSNNIANHITYHYYQDDEGLRLITLGMEKFGLPNLVINDVSPGTAAELRGLMFVMAQLLLQGNSIGEEGRFTVSFGDIQDREIREEYEQSVLDGGTGEVVVHVGIGETRSGDPAGRLMEVLFPQERALRYQAQSLLGTQLFGSADTVLGAEAGNRELLAARSRARQELFSLLEGGFESLPPESQLLIKLPFDAPVEAGGAEYMWISVTGLSEGTLHGVLDSDPFYISNLHAGALVEAPLDAAFDYVLYVPNRAPQGGYTNEVIERQHRQGN